MYLIPTNVREALPYSVYYIVDKVMSRERKFRFGFKLNDTQFLHFWIYLFECKLCTISRDFFDFFHSENDPFSEYPFCDVQEQDRESVNLFLNNLYLRLFENCLAFEMADFVNLETRTVMALKTESEKYLGPKSKFALQQVGLAEFIYQNEMRFSSFAKTASRFYLASNDRALVFGAYELFRSGYSYELIESIWERKIGKEINNEMFLGTSWFHLEVRVRSMEQMLKFQRRDANTANENVTVHSKPRKNKKKKNHKPKTQDDRLSASTMADGTTDYIDPTTLDIDVVNTTTSFETFYNDKKHLITGWSFNSKGSGDTVVRLRSGQKITFPYDK